MKRLVPHPLLSLALLFVWLLLNGFSLGHLLLGAAVALVAGWALGAVEPTGPRIRRWDSLVRLVVIVSIDIVRSNIAVSRLILGGGRGRDRRSGFVELPLRMQDPAPLALLAMIVTATPGTAWVEHDPDRKILLLHVFDFLDEEEWRHLILDRYEAHLLEIFE